RFVETVIGKGYRFAAPIVVNGDGNLSPKARLPGTPQPAQTGQSAAITATPAQRMHRRLPVLMLLASIGAVIAILASGWIAARHVRNSGSSAHPGIKSLVVLPLKNLSGDPAQEYLADGMTEELTGRLSAIHNLRVISRTSAMHFKDTQLSVLEIARTLRVDAIAEGPVMQVRGRIGA